MTIAEMLKIQKTAFKTDMQKTKEWLFRLMRLKVIIFVSFGLGLYFGFWLGITPGTALHPAHPVIATSSN